MKRERERERERVGQRERERERERRELRVEVRDRRAEIVITGHNTIIHNTHLNGAARNREHNTKQHRIQKRPQHKTTLSIAIESRMRLLKP